MIKQLIGFAVLCLCGMQLVEASALEYLYADSRGSIVAAVQILSPNTVKAAVAGFNHFYEYSAYGSETDFYPLHHRIGDSDEARRPLDLAVNQSGFTGQGFDRSTQALEMGNGYRAYHPEIGLFNQGDSLSPFSDKLTFNSFNYAAVNPVNSTDPTGHFSVSPGLTTLMAGTAFALAVTGMTAMMTEMEENMTTANLNKFYLRRALFMAGNAAGPAIDAGMEYHKHQQMMAIGDTVVAISGLAGSVSAQPEMMLEDLFTQNGTKEQLEMLKNSYARDSSTVSSALIGAGSAMKTAYIHKGGVMGMSWRIAAGIGSGVAAGRFYGHMSSVLGESDSILRNILIGSLRTGVTGMVADIPDITQDVIYGNFSYKETIVDIGSGFGMGAVSGVTQQWVANSTIGSTGSIAASIARSSYLFIKPSMQSAAMSGDFSGYFRS